MLVRQVNTEKYAQEKVDDARRLEEDVAGSATSLKMGSHVEVVPGALPTVEPMRGVAAGHGGEFDVHSYVELLFQNGKRIKALPGVSKSLAFMRAAGQGRLHVVELPGADDFAKVALVRVLLDNNALRLVTALR